MHGEVLTIEQLELLPLASKFHKNFGLVGETAIALQIGHRQSIDFDLFTLREFNNSDIKKVITRNGRKIGKVYKDEAGQFTFLVRDVRFTFYYYPFKIEFTKHYKTIFKMPDLLTLAAMKAYTLGRRAKWKDYIDLYFIINKYYSVKKIIKKGKRIFNSEFNERVFREQLGYFNDINYSEEIVFLPGYETSKTKIKKELINFSLS